MSDPNWAQQVTAIATSIGVIGLLGTIGRWEMWKPSVEAMPGDSPMFRALAAKMRTALERS